MSLFHVYHIFSIISSFNVILKEPHVLPDDRDIFLQLSSSHVNNVVVKAFSSSCNTKKKKVIHKYV